MFRRVGIPSPIRFAQGRLFAVTLSEAKGLALFAQGKPREESGSEKKANARFLVVPISSGLLGMTAGGRFSPAA